MKISPHSREEVYKYMHEALLSEGLQPEEMTYESDYMVVTDIGFFTYVKEPGQRYPYLHHFYINPEQRSLKNFLRLTGIVKHTILSMGFLMFVVQEPKDRSYLGKFIKFSKGIEYYRESGHTYYLVPVFKEGCKRKKHANI